jgi:hypothetical protein
VYISTKDIADKIVEAIADRGQNATIFIWFVDRCSLGAVIITVLLLLRTVVTILTLEIQCTNVIS